MSSDIIPIYEQDSTHYDRDYESRRWSEAGGGIQSLVFYAEIAARMRDLLTSAETIHDYGCGQGDGAALLQAAFPQANVVGFDFSEGAVNLARERWPTLTFGVCDIREAMHEADVIVTSHTLEHVPFADEVIARLRTLCKWLLVVVPDTPGGDLDRTHLGCEATQAWIERVRPRPVALHAYMTDRRWSRKEPPMRESNVLCVFQGEK